MGVNNIVLNRMFTRNNIDQLLKEKQSDVYSACLEQFSVNIKGTNEEKIRNLYQFMSKNYRNEYFYKNTLLNKLLLGKHSLKTTTALAEIPIENSQADFILINGKAVLYEIKTELDNFDRLENQIIDYYKAFTCVTLITSESNFEKAMSLLQNTNVGIYVLTKRNTISARKEPTDDFSKLMHESMFKLLRKYEFEIILKRMFSKLPEVNSFVYYAACLEMFSKLSIEIAYREVLIELKKRNKVVGNHFIGEVPYELKSLVYFSQYKEKNYNSLIDFLKHKEE